MRRGSSRHHWEKNSLGRRFFFARLFRGNHEVVYRYDGFLVVCNILKPPPLRAKTNGNMTSYQLERVRGNRHCFQYDHGQVGKNPRLTHFIQTRNHCVWDHYILWKFPLIIIYDDDKDYTTCRIHYLSYLEMAVSMDTLDYQLHSNLHTRTASSCNKTRSHRVVCMYFSVSW